MWNFFFFYTGKNKGVFLFISKLLIIDFVKTDKFILIRLNYKLNLFSGCADIHNIKTTLGCTCNFGMWSIPLRACSLQFSFIDKTNVSAVFWFLLTETQGRFLV